MKRKKYILLLLMLLVGIGVRGQYNPTSPIEPGVYYTLTLQATPEGAGSFNQNTVSSWSAGSSVYLTAYNYSNFTFLYWEENGEVVSTSGSFTYTMKNKDVTLTAHYEYSPYNPDEPEQPYLPDYSVINVSVTPEEGGYVSVESGNRYEVGSTVYLYAYNYYNYEFEKWTENGEVISTSYDLEYVVKDEDADLVAHFKYNPYSPDEPTVLPLNRKLMLTACPEEAGYFNIASGNKYLEGSEVYLEAHSLGDYLFRHWELDGEIISTDSIFFYTMPTRSVELMAVYEYDPQKIIHLEGELLLDKDTYVYDGSYIFPAYSFQHNLGETLYEGEHYTIEYSNNLYPGTASVTLTGILPYSGTFTAYYKIEKKPVNLEELNVTLPDSSVVWYDGQPHGVTVETLPDMGACTIYYTDEQGNWSSDMPTEVGTYTVSLIIDESFYYQGFTDDKFFTFTIAMPAAVSQEEWDILVSLYETLGGASWNNPWDMEVGISQAFMLHGVTIENGHVISIDLSGNGLYGDFPYQVFGLPYLTSLNLSGNSLVGNLSGGLESYLATVGQEAVELLVNLDISRNQLEGNIGAFASAFPNLTTLAVQENKLSEVSPMLPMDMQVTLYPQQIPASEGITIHWNDICEELLLEQLPSMATYDHANQCYKVPSVLHCQDVATKGSQWSAELTLVDGKPCWSRAGGVVTEPYMLSNGAPMLCQDAETGNSFELSFSYEAGDANFSGNVDVLDLQRIINYAFNPYTYETPFNYTMANLYQDEIINVQDVVLMVSLLLNQEVSQTVPLSLTVKEEKSETPMAALAWSGNQLVISTETAVSSFEVLMAGNMSEALVWQLPQGFTVQTKEQNGFTRVVIYSLSGSQLPIGESVIATATGYAGRLLDAVLSDATAREIPVALNGKVTAVGTLATGAVRCICKDGHVQLVTERPLHQVQWSLSGIDGRTVASDRLDRIESGNVVLLQSGALAQGTYLFRLQTAEGDHVVEKLVIK